MSVSSYNPACGGLPPQTTLATGRALISEAYTVIPKGVMSDIVTSLLPFWEGTRAWLLSRPNRTFVQYLVEVAPGGGSERPELDPEAEAVLFVVDGRPNLKLEGKAHSLHPGSYVFLAPGAKWTLRNTDGTARFHWIRKAYERVPGIADPESFVTDESKGKLIAMPDTEGVWATTRFVPAEDMRHDMQINIVTFQPGGSIPFEETHVMEHGLFVLEGRAVYRLNRDCIQVEAGDYMWLCAFCPHSCYAIGPGPFRYLLYKDVNRHLPIRPQRLGR